MKPRIPDSQKIRHDIILKLNDETYRALHKASDEHGMAATQYVRSLLCIHLNKMRNSDAAVTAEAAS